MLDFVSSVVSVNDKGSQHWYVQNQSILQAQPGNFSCPDVSPNDCVSLISL